MIAPSRPGEPDRDVEVDHVWSNLRILLPARAIAAACQLGGDGLGPHLSELADRAVVVGEQVRSGPGWSAVEAAPDRTPFAERSFDLVVVWDAARAGRPVRDVVQEARRLCRRHGVVVVGTSSRRDGWTVRREAERGRGRVFAALPSPRRPAFLLDPRDGESDRYFLRQMAFPYRAPGHTGASARVLQARNRAALRMPPRLALGATPGRVAIWPVESGTRSLLDELASFIRSSWGSLGLPGRPPVRSSTIVVAHRKTPSAVVSVLVLGGSVPIVAKLPRYGGRNAAVRREADNLELVFRAVGGALQQTLPRPLGLHVVGDSEVALQTVVPGRHLVAETAAERLSRRMLRRQLDLTFSWSASLQEASGRWVIVDDDLVDATLVPLVRSAVSMLGDDERVAALLDRAIEHARALSGTPIRMSVAHGDYWAGNILIQAGRVSGVVDWERASLDELPIWDPVKAVMDAAYHLDRYRSVPRSGPEGLPRWGELGPWEELADPQRAMGFRAVMAERSWLSDLFRDALTRAFIRAEIPVGWLPVAVPFHLVREFVHADVSARSVEGWGSVLRALAAYPGTWADELVGDRRGARGTRGPVRPDVDRPLSVEGGRRGS
jgi:SAM-dependent methyltransferase